MKKKLIIFSVFASLCCGMYPLLQKCRELYYVHVVGLPQVPCELIGDETDYVFLKVGFALAFIDWQDQLGYIAFNDSKYGVANYSLVLNQRSGVRVEKKGRVTIWNYLPWQEDQMRDCVFVGEKRIYFRLIGSNRLTFDNGPIRKVAVVPLDSIRSVQIDTNLVKWCKAVVPDV
jgi:hypothetical protein